MTDDRIAATAERGRRARLVMDEFLAPAFEQVQQAYSARLKEICANRPWDAGPISALANASRIVEEVEKQIVAIVLAGEAASKEIIRVEKVEKLTPAKRRLLGY